ncbi:MAG TPA: hypothetical protein V6D19_24005, partial [Stenomitos sp.]
MKTADPFDTLSWNVQTQLRQLWEAMQWQLMQWFASSPAPHSTTDWLPSTVFWIVRILGVLLLAITLFLSVKPLARWLRQLRLPQPLRSRTQTTQLQSSASWLMMAHDAQRVQDFRRAFEALYMALLVQLHESGVLRQDSARTDREYIQGLDQLW